MHRILDVEDHRCRSDLLEFQFFELGKLRRLYESGGMERGAETGLERLVDQLTEFISYHAIDESANLAAERGSYPNFAGSGWSKGLLPIDTVDKLTTERGVKVKIDSKSRLDWEALRQKVKKGMRNATLMAIAPTANISHVAGTTPGLDRREIGRASCRERV